MNNTYLSIYLASDGLHGTMVGVLVADEPKSETPGLEDATVKKCKKRHFH